MTDTALGEKNVAALVTTKDDRKRVVSESTTKASGHSAVSSSTASMETGHGDSLRRLAEELKIPYVGLADFVISSDLFAVLPANDAIRFGVVPYDLNGRTLSVVVSDPLDLDLEKKLRSITRHEIDLLVSSREAIAATLKRSEGSTRVLRDVSQGFKPVIIREDGEGRERSISLEEIGEEMAPVVRLINTVIMAALQKRASDVHIETYESGVTVKYRIDGVLYPATEVLDLSYHAALVSRIKVMSELDIAEKRVPQDGRFRLRINGQDIDFRVSILPSAHGEAVVIRILDKNSLTDGIEDLRLDGLGIDDQTLKRFRRSIREPYGMVLLTGPTGSGKTTTLYGALSELNSGEEKIITIEDPVEYQIPGIVQIPVNEKKQLTFARGLRSILRHDPDKVMVGEIRDVETAEIAVQSALTGHLVFTTVHANNAFDVVSRFSHWGIDMRDFVSALNCVMAQRLVRKICPNCKAAIPLDDDYLGESGLEPERYRDQVWYEGKGCDHCFGTGYMGRAAVTEYLNVTARIGDMIAERRNVLELQKAAIEEGMVTLRQCALSKALSGQTSLKEINRVTFVD